MSANAATRVAWFHCFAGISGDMALGSLLDAGADLEQVRAILNELDIDGWELTSSHELRAGLSATKAHVRVDDRDVSERAWRDIAKLLENAPLPARVAERSTSVFAALAKAEARIHNVAIDDVHFHEVGGHDAIIDIVGTCAALELLSVDTLYSGPVAHGRGLIKTRHGNISNPPPAVLELLQGAPVYGRDLEFELTTPTGAALLAALVSEFGPMPNMVVLASGYGAGGRDLDGLANVTQVVIGDLNQAAPGSSGQPLVVLETNLDDATGEQLARAVTRALDEGAADAWITPVVMKKGRPGHILSVLVDPALEAHVREVVLFETGSFGVRSSHVDRFAQSREMGAVDVDGSTIHIKQGPYRAKAEFDDAVAHAEESNLPAREIQARAEEIWRERQNRES